MPTLSLGRIIFWVRWIKHCGWYPDYRQPQLFRKGRFRYRDELVHESFDCDGPVGFLKSPALQYPFRDIDHYVGEAGSLLRPDGPSHAGARQAILFHQLITHPLGAFLKMYVQRTGFLDGMQGLILLRTLRTTTRIHQVREILGALEERLRPRRRMRVKCPPPRDQSRVTEHSA